MYIHVHVALHSIYTIYHVGFQLYIRSQITGFDIQTYIEVMIISIQNLLKTTNEMVSQQMKVDDCIKIEGMKFTVKIVYF